MRIYGSLASGNCLKIKYVCDYLNLTYEWIEIDLLNRETQTESFLSLNPTGEVPTLELEDGRTIGQSNAIMIYVGEESMLLPNDKYQKAKVNEWLFWEQYSHEPYIAVCRTQVLNLKGTGTGQREEWRAERGDKALDLMNQVLKDQSWFVGEQISLADIALVAYTRVAHEGGFDLSERIHLKDWINRCEAELGID